MKSFAGFLILVGWLIMQLAVIQATINQFGEPGAIFVIGGCLLIDGMLLALVNES